MAQFKHDRFTKFYLKELYSRNRGTINSNIEVIAHETFFIDILFSPNRNFPAWFDQNLGLLNLIMAAKDLAIIEHYSHYFEKDDFENCLLRKILYKLQNQKNLNKQEPFTWVITAKLGKKMVLQCAPIPEPLWRETLQLDLVKPKQGDDPKDLRFREPILRLSDIHNLGIVVIERLPLTPATMWLKLLGQEADCQAAYQMIKNSPSSQARSATLKACAKFNSYIRTLPKEEITEEDMVIIRSTEEIDKLYEQLYPDDYDDILAKGLAEGLAQGLTQGQILAVKNFLTKRFGNEILTDAVSQKLNQLSSQQLDDLLFQAANWNSPTQIDDYWQNLTS